MHSSLTIRYAPLKRKRTAHRGSECKASANLVEKSGEACPAPAEEEKPLSKLRRAALQMCLVFVCQGLKTVTPTNRPVRKAGLLAFISRQVRAARAFVLDPVEIVDLLLEHDALRPYRESPDGATLTPHIAGTTLALAIKTILPACHAHCEFRTPLAESSCKERILKRVRDVKLWKMSLQAAARWVLSQSYICIYISADDIINAMLEAGTANADEGQHGKVTYNLFDFSEVINPTVSDIFNMPSLREHIADHAQKGVQISDKAGRVLGCVAEDIGVVVRVAQTGQIFLKSEVRLGLMNQRHRGQHFHKFQRIAYLNKTFGKGVRGERFGKRRRRRRKGVRKDPVRSSRLFSQEPKNTSTRASAEVRKHKDEARISNASRAQKVDRCIANKDRVERRREKYFGFFEQPADDTCTAMKGQSHPASQGWNTAWLARWAVEEELEFWYKR